MSFGNASVALLREILAGTLDDAIDLLDGGESLVEINGA